MNKLSLHIRCATWNVSTLKEDEQKVAVISLMEHFEIDLLAIQETECLGQPQDQIVASTAGKSYRYFHTGERKGVGFIVAPSLCKPQLALTFHNVTPRILHLAISSGENQTSFLAAYSPIDTGPTSSSSHKNISFYSKLEEYIENKLTLSSKHQLVILGDFNCTLRQRHHAPPLIGQFALQPNNTLADKQKMNADLLTDMCLTLKLHLVNTLVKKKIDELITFQPTQKIVAARPEERMFVKDLILTSFKHVQYKVIKCQPFRHTPHHLVTLDISAQSSKRKFHPSSIKWHDQPLIRAENLFQSSKLRDIHPEYRHRLLQNLHQNIPAEVPDSELASVDLNEFYNTLTSTIKSTCQSFPKETPPKRQWCSKETIKKCIEKNEAWKKYLQSQNLLDKATYFALQKEVVKRVKKDRKTFRTEHKAAIQALNQERMSTSALVSLFFPTISTNSPTTERHPAPQKMRLAKGSPLLPIAEAVQKYLLQLYSRRPMWLNETFTPDPDILDKCSSLLKEATEAVPKFQPPMNVKKTGDGIPLHCLMGAETQLRTMLKAIVKQGKVPQEWKRSQIRLLFKKGDKRILSCYRTISLRPCITNYLERAFVKICNYITTKTTLPFQFNRKHHNCRDNIFILTSIINRCREAKIPLYPLFVDIAKAFDSVSRSLLYQTVKSRCTPELAKIIIDLHEGSTVYFEGLGALTESGVLQGDTLAAILFVWIMDEIFRNWHKIQRGEDCLQERHVCL